MKTLRIILSALAIVSAGSASLATGYNSSEMGRYIYLPPSGAEPAICKPVSVDCGGNGALCTYQDKEVRDASNIVTQCGTQLRFNSTH